MKGNIYCPAIEHKRLGLKVYKRTASNRRTQVISVRKLISGLP